MSTKIKKAGFTLVEIMIVVAIIGLLAAIGIPSFLRSREVSRAQACVQNMHQIQGAKEQWALDESKAGTDEPEKTDLDDYMRGGVPNCPVGDVEYDIRAVNEYVRCDNYDDTDDYLDKHILPGDDRT